MKTTILTEKDTNLIEQIILKYGRIVGIDDLMTIFRIEYSNLSAHNRIQKLTKAGWLKRIKRGLYLVIENLSSRFQNDNSLMLIANALNKSSYISLSYALNYYHMFDQYSKTIVSVTTADSKKYIFDDFVFKFAKVKENMFFGFSQKIEAGKIVRIADVEKALIDYLYLDKSYTSASVVFEKLREYQESLDLNKLQNYALRSDMTIRRKIGFFLDQLGVNTQGLYRILAENKGLSRFTKESKTFNAKWRIYYDNRIIG
ncbi:MAG: hypothetical protein AAB574_02400 [Patescibacteria group bacterium]